MNNEELKEFLFEKCVQLNRLETKNKELEDRVRNLEIKARPSSIHEIQVGR